MESKVDESQVNLPDTGMIELSQFDCTPFIGKKVGIAKVTEHKGSFGFYVKIETEIVAKFGEKDITASKILGLQEDANGHIGWGEKTKLGVFLKKYNVAHYKDLVGKEVVIQTKTSKEGVDFLDFN